VSSWIFAPILFNFSLIPSTHRLSLGPYLFLSPSCFFFLYIFLDSISSPYSFPFTHLFVQLFFYSLIFIAVIHVFPLDIFRLYLCTYYSFHIMCLSFSSHCHWNDNISVKTLQDHFCSLRLQAMFCTEINVHNIFTCNVRKQIDLYVTNGLNVDHPSIKKDIPSISVLLVCPVSR
jgi:hypothetical protein